MYENSKPGQQIIHENRPYAFETYNAEWPALFEQYATDFRTVLGDEAKLIEHVGSTSVPGMDAKPQIDVLVTVPNLAAMAHYYVPLNQLGYIARGDYTNSGEEYFTKDDAQGTRLASVHVLPVGHRWAIELLDFRDYLRTHPDEVAAYSTRKRQGNQRYPDDYTNYYIYKDAYLKDLKLRAKRWRDSIGA